MAAREVVLWMTFTAKDRFEDWANWKRKEEELRFAEVQRKDKERRERVEEEGEQAKVDEAGGWDAYLMREYGIE